MRKRNLIIVIAALAVSGVVLAFAVNQELIVKHRYPQDALHDDANLAVRGIVASVEQNYVTRGMIFSNYHIFRLYIRLNITEVTWANSHMTILIGGDKVSGSNIIGVGYDYLDNPQLAVGQEIECKGFYLGVTDTSYSFILTVAPSVNESYLKPQI